MIKLAIFDMDGTVFESYLDWFQIRKELGIKTNILKEIYQDGRVDQHRLEILENYEENNTLKTKPVKGISQCLGHLENRCIKTALVTNNNKKNTDFLLDKFSLNFDTVITREMNLWKPDPDAFFYVMELYRCRADEVIAIGDSHYDVKAAKAANIPGIFIINNENRSLRDHVDDSGVVYFDNFFILWRFFLQAKEPGRRRHVDMSTSLDEGDIISNDKLSKPFSRKGLTNRKKLNKIKGLFSRLDKQAFVVLL